MKSANMSNGNKPKYLGKPPRPIVRIDDAGNILEYFPKGKDIIERHPEWKLDCSAISNFCNGLRKRCKGFLFRFATPEEITRYSQFAAKVDQQILDSQPAEPEPEPEPPQVIINVEAEVISAQPEKPSMFDNEGLSPFEQMLKQSRGKFGE